MNKSDATVTFAPFGIGIRNVPVNEVKERAMKGCQWFKEKAKDTGLIALGTSIMTAEVVLRHVSIGLRKSADGLIITADKVEDVRGAVVLYGVDKEIPGVKGKHVDTALVNALS